MIIYAVYIHCIVHSAVNAVTICNVVCCRCLHGSPSDYTNRLLHGAMMECTLLQYNGSSSEGITSCIYIHILIALYKGHFLFSAVYYYIYSATSYSHLVHNFIHTSTRRIIGNFTLSYIIVTTDWLVHVLFRLWKAAPMHNCKTSNHRPLLYSPKP